MAVSPTYQTCILFYNRVKYTILSKPIILIIAVIQVT